MSQPHVRVIAPSEAQLLLPFLAQVQDLHVAAHADIFHSRATSDERRAFLEDWLARDRVEGLAAFHDGQVAVGYLIYEIQEREAGVLKSASRVGFLHQIAVDQAFRRQGIGSLLISEMKARLRRAGIRRLRSEHYAFNEASASLLRSAGLRPLRITVDGVT